MASTSASTPVLDFLRNTRCWDIIGEKEKNLVTVSENCSVVETLNVLVQNGISAAPVLDEDGDPIGTIDMLDLVSYAAKKLDPELTGQNLTTERVDEFLKKAPISQLMDFSLRNAWHSVPAIKSLKKAMPFLSHPNIHRVFLTGEDGRPKGVLTQSKAIEYFLKNRGQIEGRLRQSVRELFPEARPALSVGTNSPLIEAFKRIHQSGVSGVAITDADGALAGCISATDLKFVKWDNLAWALRNLNQPLVNFLNQRDKRAELFGEGVPHFDPVVALMDDTLEKVMQVAYKEKCHRVFVVDKDKKPVRDISLGDMIGQLNF